jgi:hypothetical protein
MATIFTIHLKDIVSEDRPFFSSNGIGPAAGRVVNLLKTYLEPVIKINKAFSSVDVRWSPDSHSPALLDTDVIVYVVPDAHKSIIAANGGSVARAVADTNILGLTDLNSKICEVYFDRMFQGSPKELAGAAYHEAAHIKSNMDDRLHNGQDGFLNGAPDYNGSPSTKNTTFMATHLGRKVSMRSGL